MKSLCGAWLDGLGLQDIDPALLLTEIVHIPAAVRCTDVSLPGGPMLAVKRETRPARVLLRFAVHEEEPVRRAQLLERAAAWALRGGRLTVSDRPGQALRVRCTELPEHSTLHWTKEMTLAFEGRPQPLWRDLRPRTAEITGRSGSADIWAPGCGVSPVSVTLQAQGRLTAVRFSAGESFIEMEGLQMDKGERLTLGESEETGFTEIRRELTGESLLAKRTARSSDRLCLRAGRRGRLSLSADADVNALFEVWGVHP